MSVLKRMHREECVARDYEIVMLFQNNFDTDSIANYVDGLRSEVERISCDNDRDFHFDMIDSEDWGCMNSAYPIRDFKKFHYFLIKISTDPISLSVMVARMQSSREILIRSLTLFCKNGHDRISSPLRLEEGCGPDNRFNPRSLSYKKRGSCDYEDYISYKNPENLVRFTPHGGNIASSRVTGLKAKMQRRMRGEVQHAKFLGLFSYKVGN